LHFFAAKPYVIDEKSNFGGTSNGNQFVGQNPPTSAQITYFMSKRHTFGKMSMEIVDAEGKLVTTLQPGKQKGINTVSWSFNSMVPKSAKGKTFGGTFVPAPTVKAGKYKVRITKGTELFEQDIEVKYDLNSIYTLAERSKQQEVTMQLFNNVQDLAYLVYQIDQWDQVVENYIKKNPKASKNTIALGKKLDALREELVVTTGDNYVGTAEPRLREKLSDLYASIANYPGQPSSSQIETIDVLRSDYTNHLNIWNALQSAELKKFISELEKQKLPKVEIKAMEDFLKEE